MDRRCHGDIDLARVGNALPIVWHGYISIKYSRGLMADWSIFPLFFCFLSFSIVFFVQWMIQGGDGRRRRRGRRGELRQIDLAGRRISFRPGPTGNGPATWRPQRVGLPHLRFTGSLHAQHPIGRKFQFTLGKAHSAAQIRKFPPPFRVPINKIASVDKYTPTTCNVYSF